METKHKVFSNLLWRFAERAGAQIVQFVVSIILARIIAPEHYGTIALITVFISIIQVFVDSGLGNALIQKKNADQLDFSTVFYVNIIFCTVLYIALFFFAPVLANFYNDESIIWPFRVMGLVVLVSGLKNVQQAYVSRHMLFRKFFYSTLLGTILAAVVGIVLAYKGFGIWALVLQLVLNTTVDTLVLWITVKWRPTLQFSFDRLKGLFKFGWKLLVSHLIDTTYDNVRQLVIGKMYSTADLAYYNRAKQIPYLVINNVNTSIESVLFPSMSDVQDEKSRVLQMTRRSIRISMFVLAPVMVGIAFTANNIIVALLTDKWIESVPFLTILSFYFLLWPIHSANLNAVKAIGRSDIFLRVEILKKVIGVTVLIISLRFGTLAIAFGVLLDGIIALFINSWPNRKLINYKYSMQLRDVLPTLTLALAMGCAVLPINMFDIPALPALLLQILIGAVVYIFGAKITKNESLDYVKMLLIGVLKRARGSSR